MTRKQENTRVRRSGSAHTTPTTTTTPTFFGGADNKNYFRTRREKHSFASKKPARPSPSPATTTTPTFFGGAEQQLLQHQKETHNFASNKPQPQPKFGGANNNNFKTFFRGAEQQLLLYKKDKAQLCKQKATVPTPAPDNNNNDFNLYLWEQGGAEPQPPLVHDPACPSSMGSSHFGWNQVNTHPKKRCHLRTHWLKSNHEATFSSLSAGFSMYRPVGHGIRSPGLVPVLPVFNPIG